jgi:hypothetical protein
MGIRSPIIRLVGGILFSMGFTLALLEISLRSAPGLLAGNLANAAYSAFRDWPLGMYTRDRELRMNFMRPHFETRAYWNGYWWRHRTDAWGFRNPDDLARKSLVLLGDSMIYGLGVEEEDTVAHFLRADHGRAAYNMARQGDSLFQEYVLARLYLPAIAPESAVLFVFVNDFREIEANRPAEEIADPAAIEGIDYDALRARVDHPEQAIAWSDRLAALRVWRVGRALVRLVGDHYHPSDEGRQLTAAILDDARFAPLARYYRIVLADLAQRCRAQHGELALVLLEVPDTVIPDATAAQTRMRGLLDEIAHDERLRFVGTREIFEGCSPCFLSGDGHLSREGHRRLAALIAAEVPASSVGVGS